MGRVGVGINGEEFGRAECWVCGVLIWPVSTILI